jgi:malate dehydrogenase (oxaloacetate-decarboxylating)(NADP+)
MKLIYDYGFNPENCIMCDTRGVIYNGRAKGMNPYKQKFAVNSDSRKTLEDAFNGVDIAIGLS